MDDKLIKAAKLRVRVSSGDFDEDIRQLAETAISDLKRIGVSEDYLGDCSDPIIREAIITFINANFGNNPDSEKLMRSYDMWLTKIKGGNYRGGHNSQPDSPA